MSLSFKSLGYNFYTNPIKFTRYFAREYPSYFWSLIIGLGAPAGFAAYPYIRERLGLDNSRPDFPPLNYPLPNRPRFPPKGFEDPPADKLEPVWYRHVPPASVKAAVEAAGISWEDALKDFEARRDAMVEGEELDVSLENGKVVWNKPSEATMRKRIESAVELRQWGEGWRKYITWGIWKLMGSPEGVFEVEGGKVDGKLVLRELKAERAGKKVEKEVSAEENIEKA